MRSSTYERKVFFMKKIILFLLLFLAAIGIDYEINSIRVIHLSNVNALFLLVAILLLSLYIIPVIFLLSCYKKYFSTPIYLLSISLVFGCFIPGWMAAYGNETAKFVTDVFIQGSSSLNAWTNALTTSLTEEILKGACGIGVIYLLRKRKLSDVFIIGTCVGLGFQIVEDISYIVNQASESMKEIFPQTLLRISGALSSHWAYTGLFVLGVFCLRSKNCGVSSKRKYVWVLSPIVLHFLWNSPLNEWMLGDIPVVSALLTTVTLLLIIQTVHYFLQIEKDHKAVKV